MQQLVAGDVVSHHITQMQTLRRCVLDVPHVEIEAAAIQEEATVARRFLVVPVMQIDGARLCLPEEEIFYFDRPGVGMPASVFSADEATVFRFDSGDAIH